MTKPYALRDDELDEGDDLPAEPEPPDPPTVKYEGPTLAATLLVRMGLMTKEQAQTAFEAQQLDSAKLNPVAAMLAKAHTTKEIGQASRSIAELLVSGRLEPQQARTALYAMQIALTAANLEEAANSRKELQTWKQIDNQKKRRPARPPQTLAASTKPTPPKRGPGRPKGTSRSLRPNKSSRSPAPSKRNSPRKRRSNSR